MKYEIIGEGFLLLFSILLALKLFNIIDWSWWLITMPIWCPALIAFGAILAFGYLIAKFKG